MNRKHIAIPPWILLVAILLLGFSLRIWNLDARPLWWDEGLTLTFSRLPPRENARFAVRTAEPNPPVYRWAVGGLTSLTGTNVFTSRLVTVYSSIFTAAIFYALVKRGFGLRPALWAILLFVTAPIHIYYAQEAKGYAFTAAFVLLSVLAWDKLRKHIMDFQPSLRDRKTRQLWLVLAVSTSLAIGANYLAIFAYVTLVIISLIISILAVKRGARLHSLLIQWAVFLTSLAVGILLLAPFMIWTLTGTATGLSETSTGLPQYYPHHFAVIFLNAFGSGVRPIGLAGIILSLILLGLSTIGFYRTYRSGRKLAAWFTLAWIVIPLILGYIFHLFYPWFFPRFLLYAQVGLLALSGAGIASLATVVRSKDAIRRSSITWIVVILILMLSGYALATHYDAPAENSEDYLWPELFTLLQEKSDPDDLIIASYPWMPGYMYAYMTPDETPSWELGFFDRPKINEQMGTLAEYSDRIWEIDYLRDPFNPPVDSVGWFHGRSALAFTIQSGPATLSLFVDGRKLTSGQNVDDSGAAFENGIVANWTAVDTVVEPGDFAGVQITWLPQKAIDDRLVRFLHLLNKDGQLVAQVDREPVMGSSPTYEWLPGEEYVDPIALLLPLDLPAGKYTLIAGFYDRDTLQRIRLDSGADSVNVGTVIVN